MAKSKRAGASFDPAVFEAILERHAAGETIASILRTPGMPARRTFYDWLEDEDRAAQFARARDVAMDAIADEAARIADTQVEAIIRKESEKGVEITREDALGHRKLQVETRLKLLAKWAPRKYGDKLELSGDADRPLTVQVIRLTEGAP